MRMGDKLLKLLGRVRSEGSFFGNIFCEYCKTERKEINGWVLYDGDCALCIDLARHFKDVLARQGFELLPLQTPGRENGLA